MNPAKEKGESGLQVKVKNCKLVVKHEIQHSSFFDKVYLGDVILKQGTNHEEEDIFEEQEDDIIIFG